MDDDFAACPWRFIRTGVLFVVAGCLLSLPTLAANLVLHVALNGNDGGNGTSSAAPLRTLNAVEREVATQPPGPLEVEVLLHPGRYMDQSIDWTVARQGLSIRFKPLATDKPDSVIFDGTRARARRFFTFDPSRAVPLADASAVRFTFEDIRIENFCEGISFGDISGGTTTSGHTLRRVSMRWIGSRYDPRMRAGPNGRAVPVGDCTAAVRLSATSESTITGSRFADIDNLPSGATFHRRYGPGLLHAIYISTSSRRNLVADNVFSGFTGSPVRVRDRSDETQVIRNVFEGPRWPDGRSQQRRLFAVSQWYCNKSVEACVEAARHGRVECPSTGLVYRDNRVGEGIELYGDESQSRDATCAATMTPVR